MSVNKRSLKNLNPGIKVTWNGLQFKSIAEMSRVTNIPSSTIQDYFKSDKPVKGHYIDELI